MSDDRVDKAAIPAGIVEMYAKIDAGRLEEYIDLYAEDAELRFASTPVLHGKQAIQDALSAAGSAFRTSHRFINVWEVGNSTLLEVEVTWILPDGTTLAFPAVVIYERRDGLIANQRIFTDPPTLPAG